MKKIITLILIFFVFINYNQFAQKFRWAKIGDGASIRKCLTDTLNNVIILGSFNKNSFNFGELSIDNLNDNSNKVFLAKFNSAGKGLWIKSIYTNDSIGVYPVGASVNKLGNLAVIVQTTSKNIYVNGIPYFLSSSNNSNVVILMFHRTGKLLWMEKSNVIGNNGFVNVNDLFFTDNNEIYITGSYYGDSLIIGNKWLKNVNPSFQNYFSAKLNLTGNVEWLNGCNISWVEMGLIEGKKLVIDQEENVYITGLIEGTMGQISFTKTDIIQNIREADVFIVSYTNNGNFRWVKHISGKYSEIVPKLFFDGISKNLLLSTVFNSDTVKLETLPNVINSSRNYDLFITAIDKEGNFRWKRSFDIKIIEPSSSDFIVSVKKGEIILLTKFEGATINIDNQQIANTDNANDLVLLKLNASDGTTKWYVSISGPGYNSLRDLDFDMKGNVDLIIPISPGTPYINIKNERVNNLSGFSGNLYVKINPSGNIDINKPVFYQSELDGVDFQFLNTDLFGNAYIAGYYMGLSNLDTLTIGNMSGNRLPGIFISKLGIFSKIYGKIFNKQGEVIRSGYVKLYGRTIYQRSPVEDSVAISPDGSFIFNNIPVGIYFLLAKANDNRYLPTYYPSGSHWTDAQPVLLTANEKEANVILNNSQTLNGNNTLSGMIQESDSLNVNNKLLKSTKSIMKRPIKNATVVLISRTKSSNEYGTVVAITYTDEYGDFSFSNVPDGYYTILIDDPGLPHESYYDIYVSGGNIYGSLDYEVGLERIYTLNNNYNKLIESKSSNNLKLEIYPHPVHDKCNIKIANQLKDDYVRVKLLTMSGKLIKEELYKLDNGMFIYNVENIPAGMYIISIYTNEDVINQKLIVR